VAPPHSDGRFTPQTTSHHLPSALTLYHLDERFFPSTPVFHASPSILFLKRHDMHCACAPLGVGASPCAPRRPCSACLP
jgi:hypothetical protein